MEIDKEKIEKFLDIMSWHFSEKETPMGFYNAVAKISGESEKLNQNIEKFNESSSKLTSALNRITLAGVIIAGLGILIAIFK